MDDKAFICYIDKKDKQCLEKIQTRIDMNFVLLIDIYDDNKKNCPEWLNGVPSIVNVSSGKVFEGTNALNALLKYQKTYQLQNSLCIYDLYVVDNNKHCMDVIEHFGVSQFNIIIISKHKKPNWIKVVPTAIHKTTKEVLTGIADIKEFITAQSHMD